MNVIPITAENGRFMVEGESLSCDRCEYTVPIKRSKLSLGDECPRCTKGHLEVTHHLVDIVLFDGIGDCQCEGFCKHHDEVLGGSQRQRLTLMSPKQRQALRGGDEDRYRCKHIKAARNFELNTQIDRYIAEQRRPFAIRAPQEGDGP
jgi:hypothetical protein